jgi:hypothetical protein
MFNAISTTMGKVMCMCGVHTPLATMSCPPTSTWSALSGDVQVRVRQLMMTNSLTVGVLVGVGKAWRDLDGTAKLEKLF